MCSEEVKGLEGKTSEEQLRSLDLLGLKNRKLRVDDIPVYKFFSGEAEREVLTSCLWWPVTGHEDTAASGKLQPDIKEVFFIESVFSH